MGKHEPNSPKAIANRIKSKGLQKLRWYCQMCQKQCRDQVRVALRNNFRFLNIFVPRMGSSATPVQKPINGNCCCLAKIPISSSIRIRGSLTKGLWTFCVGGTVSSIFMRILVALTGGWRHMTSSLKRRLAVYPPPPHLLLLGVSLFQPCDIRKTGLCGLVKSRRSTNKKTGNGSINVGVGMLLIRQLSI